MGAWEWALASVLVVSALSFVGAITLAISRERLKGVLLFFVSFAVGALFGDAFIHLIPEAFERMGAITIPWGMQPGMFASVLIIAGVLVFFVLEKFVRWRHCHVPTSEDHPHPVATINLVGDGMHNLIDGMIIGASYLVSLPIGVATTLAVVLHEIPQEMGDFGILLHAGMKARRALLFNFMSALTAVVGAVIALALGTGVEWFAVAILPVTAGGFIYMAGTDLIPELHREVKVARSAGQFAAIVLGVAVMVALLAMG